MNRSVFPIAPVAVSKIALDDEASTPQALDATISGVFDVIICSNVDCFIVFGPNAADIPDPETDGFPLAADVQVGFQCSKATAFVSACAQVAMATGNLYYYIPGQTAI